MLTCLRSQICILVFIFSAALPVTVPAQSPAVNEKTHFERLTNTTNRFAEGVATVKALEKAAAERRLGLAVTASLAIFAAILFFNFRKTRKLNRQLKQSNIIKDKLFSILAHDLRGPAASVAQSLALVKENVLPPAEERQLLGMLTTQSAAFADTLQALLEWANSQFQGLSTSQVRFDAKEIIRKNCMVLSGQATAKQIRIEDNTPSSMDIFADTHQFDITLRNLVSNAVKFSHPGSTVRIGAKENEEGYVVSVQDDGVGISELRQKQFNAEGIDVMFGTKGEKGTGLGLLMAREFAQASGGKLWLTSEEGKGTTFYFSVKKIAVNSTAGSVNSLVRSAYINNRRQLAGRN